MTEDKIKEAFDAWLDNEEPWNYGRKETFRAGYLALLNSPELEQCRKDAERYRWLRDQNDDPELYLVTAPEELDAAIDKAMESV